jgi:hypothetical protein
LQQNLPIAVVALLANLEIEDFDERLVGVVPFER